MGYTFYTGLKPRHDMEKFKTFLKQNWIVFLVSMCVFLNGFQAGGNQAFLVEIGKSLNVDESALGSLAAAQWGAVIIAPLIVAVFADKVGKKPFILGGLGLFLISSIALIFVNVLGWYLAFVFCIGLALSIYQFVGLAIVADVYPKTQEPKLAFSTSAYSIGAIIAPLLAKLLSANGQTWHWLYIILSVLTALIIIGLLFTKIAPVEQVEVKAEPATAKKGKTNIVIVGLIVLLLISAVYVGAESGIAYFLKPFITDALKGENAEYAISLFWLGMLPSRWIISHSPKAKKAELVISAAILAACCFSFSFMDSLAGGFAMAFFFGFFAGPVYPAMMSYSVKFTKGKTALATGLTTSATGIGGAAVTASFSLIQSQFGIRNAFIFVGAVAALCCALCVWLVLEIKKEDRREAKAASLTGQKPEKL